MMHPSKIRIIIADDHALYIEGLQAVLSGEADIEIVATAYEGNRLVQLTQQHLPDVVLTDLKMPGTDGIQAIREITALNLACHCIALSTFDTDYLIIEALEAGAMGYVTKNAQQGEIIEAIKTVNGHHAYYCKTTSYKLARQIARSNFNPYQKPGTHLFSDIEKDIIRLICEGKTSEEISKELFIAKRTIDGMRARILEKAEARTPVALVVYAIKNAIYFIPS